MNEHQKSQSYKLYRTVGSSRVWQIQGQPDTSPFFYTTGMSIDIDGAPDADAPRGSGLQGRDALDNACPVPDRLGRKPYSSGWTPTYTSTVRDPRIGASVVQQAGATRGYYISTTSLKDVFHGSLQGEHKADIEYQTDARVYPYIALPERDLKSSGLKVSDYALAIHGFSGQCSFAAYGDFKYKHVLGESSCALAAALGVRSDRSGAVGRGIVYIVFPDSGLGKEMRCPLENLPANGKRWLDIYDRKLDLIQKVTACFSPELPGVALALRRFI